MVQRGLIHSFKLQKGPESINIRPLGHGVFQTPRYKSKMEQMMLKSYI